MTFQYERDEKYDEYEYDEYEYDKPYDEYEQAKYEVETAVYNAIVDCLKSKCNSKESNVIQYISPQELLSYLPKSLAIDRYTDIIKHGSGQWELRNDNIRAYIGFQVQTHDSDTISVIKHLIRMNSEQYRYDNGIIDDQKETDACVVCNGVLKIDPRFGVHICRVSGHFKCFNYNCNGREFKVGICLLDPNTFKPPTRYKCANCGNRARFIRYDLNDLKQNAQNEQNGPKAQHRKDLCEACDIWTDCRLSFVQPSAIFNALSNAYYIQSLWKINEYDGTVTCSFSMPVQQDDGYDQPDGGYKRYVFDIKPYVYCHYVNTKQLYYVQNNFSPNQKNFSHNPKRNTNRNKNKNKKQQKQRGQAVNIKSRKNKQNNERIINYPFQIYYSNKFKLF